MANWLTLSSFEGRVNLPRAFKLSALDTFITGNVEEWLTDLIGEMRVAEVARWLTSDPILDRDDDVYKQYPGNLYLLIEPFLVYACWADFILQGGVTAGETGMIVQETANSEPLSDARRAELHRHFKGRAERKATRIVEYVNKDANPCESTLLSGATIRISTARGRTKSLFD